MIDRRSLLAALILLFGALELEAQESYRPLAPLPLGSFLLTMPSNHTTAAGTWQLWFNHRFGVADEDPADTLFGLDAGANVGFGAIWSPRRDLDLMLVRTNVLDTIEIAGRYVVVQQAPAIPFTLAMRAGADIRTADGADDRTSLFVQAIASRRIGPRLELFAIPTWSTDAGRSATDDGSVATFSSAINVPLGAAFHAGRGLTFLAEVIPPNADLRDDADPGWALGVKKAIGGHHFEIVASNSAATTVDQYVASMYQGRPFVIDELHFGFNISRTFGQ